MTVSNSSPYASRFESIGVKVPSRRLASKELMSKVKSWGKIDLEGLTGIKERRVCSKGEDSYSLAADAAGDCLKHSKYKPQDLEMIICCSITKYKGGLSFLFEPPLSLFIRDAIGATQAVSFDVTNACAGMLTGVFILDDFIKRGAVRCGMVVSGEYITHLGHNAAGSVRTIASPQLASLTLGDGGAAAILERSDKDSGLIVSHFVTLPRYSGLCIGQACKDSPGGQMKTQAAKIHKVAIENSPPIVEQALKESGLAFDEIDYAIPHQTSVRAISSGLKHHSKYFGVKPRNVVVNLEEYGNTASTTHFIALYRYLNKGKFKPGDKIMLLCYASGLVVGVMIFTMDELAQRYGNDN